MAYVLSLLNGCAVEWSQGRLKMGIPGAQPADSLEAPWRPQTGGGHSGDNDSGNDLLSRPILDRYALAFGFYFGPAPSSVWPQ